MKSQINLESYKKYQFHGDSYYYDLDFEENNELIDSDLVLEKVYFNHHECYYILKGGYYLLDFGTGCLFDNEKTFKDWLITLKKTSLTNRLLKYFYGINGDKIIAESIKVIPLLEIDKKIEEWNWYIVFLLKNGKILLDSGSTIGSLILNNINDYKILKQIVEDDGNDSRYVPHGKDFPNYASEYSQKLKDFFPDIKDKLDYSEESSSLLNDAIYAITLDSDIFDRLYVPLLAYIGETKKRLYGGDWYISNVEAYKGQKAYLLKVVAFKNKNGSIQNIEEDIYTFLHPFEMPTNALIAIVREGNF